MTEDVLSQASAWGFDCNSEDDGNWQILPQQKNEKWKLQLMGDIWLLSVGNVPQISLHPHEVIAFLELRRYSSKCSTS